MSEWEAQLKRILPIYGHRNWVVIADAAYPEQSNPGITTITANESQLVVTRRVLNMIAAAHHVNATVYIDAELKFLDEHDAPGIHAYRKGLFDSLPCSELRQIPHDEIIAKLDAAASTFLVLVIKTPMALPYTSVFLELGCGYWNDAAESRLRNAMKK
jgi:hypothetical protein